MRLSEFNGDFLTIRVKIKVEKDDGLYFAFCPDLPGVYAQADTVADAVRRAWGCIDDFIQMSIDHDDDIPDAIVRVPRQGGIFASLARALDAALTTFNDEGRFVTDVPLTKPSATRDHALA